jgi:hypothetical protein
MWDYAIQGAQTGIAAPTSQAATAAPGGWYDQTKQWNAADPVSGALPLKGLKYYPPETVTRKGANDEMETVTIPAYAVSSNGTKLNLTQNADGTMSFRDTYQDPAGASVKDKMDVDYTYDPKSGVAIPTNAVHRYQASDWVDKGQSIATVVGMMAAAYLGGAGIAGMSGTGTAAGTGVAGGSAATGNMALIESGLGTTGYGVSSATGTIAAGGTAATGAAASIPTAGSETIPAAAAETAAPEVATGGTNLFADGAVAPSYSAADTAAVTGSTAFADAAKAAGQTVVDFAKSPAGIKLIGAALTAAAASGASGGGGSGSTDSQNGVAAAQVAVGKDQIDWNKAVYAAGQATRDAATKNSLDAATTQLGTAQQQAASATDYDAYMKSTLRPLEQKIATDALNYDTPGRRADAIASSTSDVEQGYKSANDANTRALRRSGVSTGSGRMQALMADQAIAKANSLAGASTTAVKNVETTGATRMSDAAKLLGYLPSAQTAAANSSTAAGTAAAGSSANAVATQGAGVTNVNTGYAGQVAANNSAGNLYGQAASEQNKTAAADAATLGQLGSAVGTWAASDNGQKTIGDVANWISDEKKKKGTGKRGNRMQALAEVNKTPVDTGWQYDPKKGGPDEKGRKHTGPMAAAVRRTMGEKVAPGGKTISPMDMNGKMMLALQGLSAKVDKLEKRVA